MTPRSGLTSRIRWVPRAQGRGAGKADPPRLPDPPRSGAPPRTRVGTGCWRRPAAGTPQPSPRAAAAVFARPGGPSLAAGNPRCPRLLPGGAQSERLVTVPVGGQDADLCTLSRPYDPEHVDPRKEGASRLHLQPQWPRHDPLLLRQRGHLAERHQPAVSAPCALPPSANTWKVCFSAVTFPGIPASKRGQKCTVLAWRSRGARGGRGVEVFRNYWRQKGVSGRKNPLREFLVNFEGI